MRRESSPRDACPIREGRANLSQREHVNEMPQSLSRAAVRRRIWLLAVIILACARAEPRVSSTTRLPTPLSTGSPGINAPSRRTSPYVVLVSFDGFRHDYLDRSVTPNFDRLAERGARADALIPVFPTKTYPNHYSIATGLYTGAHGIVANEFYDSTFNATYRLGDRTTVEDGRWYDGEPIWVTAERQGMVTAAMFFIGTEAPVKGIQPTYWNRYDHARPNGERIATVLDWLRMPEDTRPHLVTLYFSVLDDAGHRYGPDAPETMAALRQTDSLLGDLMAGIESLAIREQVYLVVVSDHGMITTDGGTVILDDYTTFATEDVVISAGTLAQIHVTDESRRQRIARELSAMPGATTYLRENLPEVWHIRDNPRIGDIVVVANEGVLLSRRGFRPTINRATHGYAPMPSMYGIFLAAGPRIAWGARVSAFENVHIYPLLAEILGLRPADNIDGDLDVLRSILRPDRSDRNRQQEGVSSAKLPDTAYSEFLYSFN